MSELHAKVFRQNNPAVFGREFYLQIKDYNMLHLQSIDLVTMLMWWWSRVYMSSARDILMTMLHTICYCAAYSI